MNRCPHCQTRDRGSAETCGHPHCVAAQIWAGLAVNTAAKPRARARALANQMNEQRRAQAVALVARRAS